MGTMGPRCATILLIVFLAVGRGTPPAGADETDTSGRTEVPTIVGSVHQFSSNGFSVEVVSDAATWDPGWERSFRTVRVRDDAGRVMYRAVLPIDTAPDFPYQVVGTDVVRPLAVVYSRSVLYVLDPASGTFSPPVHPLSEDEIIGVDARSGGLFHLTFSADGRHLDARVRNGYSPR